MWLQSRPHAVRLLGGLCGTSTAAAATPSANAACPGAPSSARTWEPTSCRPWKTGCGWKATPTAFGTSAGGSGPARTGPANGLRPDGIEDEANPNKYRSGALINVSMWDMMDKKFCELGQERTLQGGSGASPGEKRRTAGDRKLDKKWRDYQESLAAEAAQTAENETEGGTPAPSLHWPSGGHHPGHTTLGDFLEVTKRAKANP